MFSPILGELVAREQYKDRLRQAELDQLAKTVSAHQPAQRFDLRTSRGSLAIAVRHLFNALAHRLGAI
jgi:hypothetical protein